jgi:hypothetical protein
LDDFSAVIYDSKTGARLASATLTHSCDEAGWATIPLSEPFHTVAGGEYIVAIDSLLHYVKTKNGFSSPGTDGTVTMSGGAWGVLTGAMPSNFVKSNYFIDGRSLGAPL